MIPVTCVPCPLSSYAVSRPFTKSTNFVTRWPPTTFTAELEPVVGQVVVPGSDAGVDHRDADAGAVVTVLLLHRPGALDDGRAIHLRRRSYGPSACP